MYMKSLKSLAIASLAVVAVQVLVPAAPALAQDAYLVGVSAAMTGRGSAGYAPVAEAIKIYFAGLNQKGGVNGHPVKILIRDNQAQASKGASDAKRFVNQEGVHLMMNVSLSSTYAPMVAESRKSKTPLLFAGVCPREVYPPANDLQACATAYAAGYDARFAMDYIKAKDGSKAKIGLVSMAIPISRAEVDRAAKLADSMGMKAVANESAPPPTPDYSPFATKIIQAGANWAYSWAPWVTQIKTFQALRKLGWKGTFITYAHNNAEEELKRVKDEGLLVYGANAMFQDNLPVHAEIKAAYDKAGSKFPLTYFGEGWAHALALEGLLKNVAWPPTRAKVAAALDNVDVDLKGLRGGNLTWTSSNHFRTRHHYRVYRWDNAKQGIIQLQDWTSYDIK